MNDIGEYLTISENVLIETLWNVNGIKVFSIFLTISVLIETLWNVNQHLSKEVIYYA